MRIFLIAAVGLLVAACTSEEPVNVGDDAAAKHAASSAEFSPAGMTFEVEGEPGVDRTAFGTDGTFSDYFQGRLRRTGTYEQRADGQLCFTYDDGATTECWTMDGPPNEDGWANSTRISDGLTIRARPIAEQD